MDDKLLLATVSVLMDRVAEYRRGNTALLEALMFTCWQKPEAESLVRRTLTEAGLLTDEGPNWPALEDRKTRPWDWKDAVCMLVKDPAERDRLLQMDLFLPAGAVVINDTFPDIQAAAEYLVRVAASRGQVLQVEQRPLQPLAMRNDETVVRVWSR